MPGATVQWFFPPRGFTALWTDVPGACAPLRLESEYECRVVADAQGIAQIDGLYANTAGSFVLHVSAFAAEILLGDATLELRADPRQPPLQLLPFSGDGLRGVIGTVLDGRLVARVLSAQGQPVPGATVEFKPSRISETRRGFVHDPSHPLPVSDADGYATSPPLFAGWAPGVHEVRATVYDAAARASVTATFHITITDARGELDLDLTNMWWAGPLENGWGMSVVKRAGQLFNVLFVYDAQGRPTWYVQPGGTWNDSDGWSFAGAVYSPRSSPWFAYDASRLVVGPRVGYLDTSFFGTERARMSFSFDDPSFSFTAKSLVIQDFTADAPSPLRGVADMWWGGVEQNGWGVAILEQFGGLFAVWFTYDAQGLPTWFVMPGGEWRDATTYAGTMYRTSGSPWVGPVYDASQFRVGAVGPYALKFIDANRAIFGNQRGRRRA